MKEYIMDDNHWFEKFSRAWCLLIRSHCTCGWKSRPCLTINGAGNACFNHEMEFAKEA